MIIFKEEYCDVTDQKAFSLWTSTIFIGTSGLGEMWRKELFQKCCQCSTGTLNHRANWVTKAV